MATHKPVIADELFGTLDIAQNAEKWQVIHTKPQGEKKLADYLKQNSIFYFLPLMESVRHYKYRKVTFTKPMFPGYLFARFETNMKTVILLSGRVANFLKVQNEVELLDDLLQIYTGKQRKAEFKDAEWLQKGWQVEITGGPMQGMRGIVQSQTKLSKVILQVNILRQAVSISINPAEVRIIKEFQG